MTTDPSPDLGGGQDALVSARRTGSVLDTLADYCYPLYRRLLDDRSTFVGTVDEKLDEALRDTTVELFLSRALAIGLLTGLVCWATGMVVGYLVTVVLLGGVPSLFGLSLPEPLFTIVQTVKVPALVLLSGVVFGLFGLAVGFGTPVAQLYYVADARRREIDHLLSDTIAYMYALSVGGMNQLEILESVADAEDVYGEVAMEFNTIVQETNYFDTDYRTAIRNRSVETPSEPLSQFLTDMLSIVNSGGDLTRFLDDETDKHMQLAKQRQEERLQTLELVGEMYMTVSLLPLLLIILLIIMSMIGNAPQSVLYLTVYGLIPIIGGLFLLVISTLKQDEYGDGYLEQSSESTGNSSVTDRSTTAAYTDVHRLFELVHRREGWHIARRLVRRPHELFVERPTYTLAITVPFALLWVGYAFVSGIGPRTVSAFVAEHLGGTVVYWYVPMYLTLIPLAVFYEWNQRGRHGLLSNLSGTLRKLSSANDTGMTLLESFRNVAETSEGKLEDEFERIHVKVQYGTSLHDALVEFNNRYHVPRMARIVKLISEAQQTSSQITDVLRTAALSSENHDELRRNRQTRTRIQVIIIVMTNLTLLAVIAILQVQFLEVMAEIVSSVGDTGGRSQQLALASSVNIDQLSMLLFHAIVIQAAVAGFLSGYLTDSRILSGVKYVLALSTVALLVWIPIT